MNSVDSSNTPFEGVCWSSNTCLEGGCWNCPTPPPQGGCWIVGTNPHVGRVFQKNCAQRDLFNSINLHPPNILLHPPIFEILQNTLYTHLPSILQTCSHEYRHTSRNSHMHTYKHMHSSAHISKKVEGGLKGTLKNVPFLMFIPLERRDNTSRAIVVPGTTIGSGRNPPPCNSSTDAQYCTHSMKWGLSTNM